MRRRVLLLLLLVVFAGLVLWLTEALRTQAPSDAPAHSEAARADEAGTAVLWGTTASPAAQEAAPRRGEPGRVRIVGRVLAASGTEAAAGATVAARAEGRDVSQVATDKDGRFELVYGATPTYEVDVALSIQARDGTGTTAAAQIAPQGPEVVDVGVLHLRATTRLEVRTRHDGKPVARAHVYASSVPTSSRPSQSERLSFSSTTPSFAYEAVSNDSGLAAFECLPVGAVQLFAVADGPIRGELLVSTDRGDEPVDLPLVEARDLRVQVVWREGGAPIPGCILLVRSAGRLPLVEPAVRPVTNRDGLAVLHGVPDDVALEIAVIHRDWCSAYMSGIASTAEAGTRELRIEIPAALTLRFPIRIQDGPNPPDGTQVELLQSDWAFWPGSRLGLARSGVIDGSELVVDFHRMFHERATARLPDGRVGGLVLTTDYDRTTKRSHPRLPLAEVVFAYPRTVVVEVRERRTGRGVPGVSVRAFLRGCDRTTAPVRTDQDGEARIDGLPAVKGWVSACSNPELVRPSRQGVFSQRQDIDLGEGDAHLTFEVEPLQEGIVQVTTEGRRELPAGFAAEIWLLPEGLTWRTPDDLVIDPRLAQVRFQIRPSPTEAAQPARVTHAGEVLLRLTSDTHATEHVRLAAGRPLVAEVDLLPAASLLTRVVKPDSVSVQTQLESRGLDGAWTPVWEDAVAPFPGEVPEGSSLYVGLRPGRYRIHAPRLGSSSAELDVPPGPQPATLVWDLTPSEYAEGEVVLPPGVDPRGLRIFVLEADGPPRIVASTPDLEGTHFRVQIPGDRPVVLKPLHPECQPDEEEGSATVTRSTAGLVLRMALRPR